MRTRICVMRTDGTNCDRETKKAFDFVGGDAEIVHLKSLILGRDPAERRNVRLSDYDILAIPGGFSHGDYIGSGKIFVVDLKHYLEDELNSFVESGKPVIGICNGFQVLAKYGLLPMLDGQIKQTSTLTYNESGKFECRWVKLAQPKNSKCIWTRGIETIDLPVAHGEGRFIAPDDLVQRLFDSGQVSFQYSDLNGNPTMNYPENPNGSVRAIAGICDPSGRVFGLMPHPERYNRPSNHYLAPLQKVLGTLPDHGLGFDIFRNAVEYCGG
jgi:phosphoribosylformylglycinamidine synthase subunit PurQ / glutaminase